MIIIDFFYAKEIKKEQATEFFKNNLIDEIKGNIYIGIIDCDLCAILVANTKGKNIINTTYIEKPGYKVLDGFDVSNSVLRECIEGRDN